MNATETMQHDQAIVLLPWLVNGSLDTDELAAVRDHASSCVICRRELAELEALHETIDRVGSAAPVPAPDMRRINARIDALIARQNSVKGFLSKLQEFFSTPWRLAFVAQSVALVAIMFVWLWPEPPEPAFETLTEAQSLPQGHYLRVVFDPTLDAPDIDALLYEADLELFAGPSARGVYTLRFDAALPANKRDALAQALAADQRVLFVQAIDGDQP